MFTFVRFCCLLICCIETGLETHLNPITCALACPQMSLLKTEAGQPKVCNIWVLTGYCKFGAHCRDVHPDLGILPSPVTFYEALSKNYVSPACVFVPVWIFLACFPECSDLLCVLNG